MPFHFLSFSLRLQSEENFSGNRHNTVCQTDAACYSCNKIRLPSSILALTEQFFVLVLLSQGLQVLLQLQVFADKAPLVQ